MTIFYNLLTFFGRNTVVFLLKNLYSEIVVKQSFGFFNGRFGQFGAIRVEYNQGGRLSCKKFFEIFCVFSFLVAFFFLLAGSLQKMSNFIWLARPSASLASARRPHPPRLRYFLRARFSRPSGE